MDKRKNNISLAFGVPGIILQFGGLCMSGFLSASGISPSVSGMLFLGSLLLGTAMLMIGIAYYAMAKGQSALWCLMAFLGIIGLIVLALLPDRHIHGRRMVPIHSKISDTPSINSPTFQCPQCDYQLNGIPGSACPECGRPFNPDDLTTVKVQGYFIEKTAPWMGRWSLICGILAIIMLISVFCAPIFGIVGVVLGHLARKEIKEKDLPGAGVALGGLITSYIAVGLSLIVLAVIFLAEAFAA